MNIDEQLSKDFEDLETDDIRAIINGMGPKDWETVSTYPNKAFSFCQPDEREDENAMTIVTTLLHDLSTGKIELIRPVGQSDFTPERREAMKRLIELGQEQEHAEARAETNAN